MRKIIQAIKKRLHRDKQYHVINSREQVMGFDPNGIGADTVREYVSQQTGIKNPTKLDIDRFISLNVGTERTKEWARRIEKENPNYGVSDTEIRVTFL